MASKPKSVTTTTITPAKGGGTKTVSVTRSGGSVSKTTTITPPKKAGSPASVSSGSSATSPAKLARAPLGDSWICGPNEKYPLCGPVALANSLLALTGMRATSADLERLYKAAGGSGDSGVPVPALLAAAKRTGLAGCRLESWAGVPGDDGSAGMVLLLTLAGNPDAHAAATTGDGRAAFWGEPYPIDDMAASVTDAWRLEWR